MNRQERDTHITSILLERIRKKAVLIALFFLPFIAINPGFNFNIGDMFLLIALVLSISKFRLISKVQIILLLFMITILLSFWLSLFWRRSNIDILNYGQFFYVFVLLVPFGYVIFKDISFDSIAKVYTLSGVVNACFGITQFLSSGSLFLSGQRVIKVSEFGFRATGLTTNPDELGFTLNSALIMCLYLILTEKSKIIKLIYIGIAILLVGGILSSSSRGGQFVRGGQFQPGQSLCGDRQGGGGRKALSVNPGVSPGGCPDAYCPGQNLSQIPFSLPGGPGTFPDSGAADARPCGLF